MYFRFSRKILSRSPLKDGGQYITQYIGEWEVLSTGNEANSPPAVRCKICFPKKD